MFTEEEDVQIPISKVKIVVADTTDRLVLLLNYSDPFLKKPIKAESVPPRPKRAKQKPTIRNIPRQVAIAPWERIMYLGSMYNANRQTQIALVRIMGIDYVARAGEKVEGFKILVIQKDSAEIEYDAQKKYIKRNKNI
jgi:hypothetical protein